MKALRARFNAGRPADEGLTLVEVMVAIAIIAVVAISAGSLTIIGVGTATNQERRQIAVTIASGTMETLNARSALINGSTGVSDLFTGRTFSKTDSAWQANSSVAGVSNTYETWDSTATSTSTQSVLITPYTLSNPVNPLVQSGTKYTVTTLLGTCYQPTKVQANGRWDCSTLSGYSTPPTLTPAGWTPLVRAIVIVRWTAGNNCGAGGCLFVASSLIDFHTDQVWVSHG